ncbi:MAG: DUF4340 domain-containing protein [Bacteroidetes bacterium]|nr:DUF4340 domain-containing protein [Bacteroidota bacterium]
MKRINNRLLIALLAGLVVLFFVVRYFRSSSLQGNLPANLTKIDSSLVTEIRIVPTRVREEVQLLRNGSKWELASGQFKGHLEEGAGYTTLRSLMSLRPQRLISKKREKWKDFGVSDSTGTHVKVLAGKDVEADIVIGRTGFSASSGGVFSGSAYTFVRRFDETEVYAVEGFLESQFNRGFNHWRDKSFLRLKRDSVNRIDFLYPADSSFSMIKSEGRWMLNGAPADSSAVVTFVNSLEYKNIGTFATLRPAGESLVKIKFYKDAKLLANVEGWPGSPDWVLRSTHQPDTWFSGEAVAIHKDLFRPRKSFQKGKK